MNNSTEHKPENFDWVTARAKCTSAAMFTKIRMLIEGDIDEIRQINSMFFHFVSAKENRFAVVGKMDIVQKSVIFVLENDQIVVSTPDAHLFSATVTLSNDGECRLKVSGEEYDLWQFRKKALEDLFFDGYPE
jgi:hypothetical protein